jgi:hypothetical protein
MISNLRYLYLLLPIKAWTPAGYKPLFFFK